jgi:hypothetical protein
MRIPEDPPPPWAPGPAADDLADLWPEVTIETQKKGDKMREEAICRSQICRKGQEISYRRRPCRDGRAAADAAGRIGAAAVTSRRMEEPLTA